MPTKLTTFEQFALPFLFSIIIWIVFCSATCNGQTVINSCGASGDAKANLEKLLNPLKNRFTAPATVNPKITLEAMLAPGEDDARFLNTDAATITGFVVSDKLGGVESCNCHSADPHFMDRHIYVGATKNAAKKDCVIVEVTPRFYAAHPEWMTIGTSHEAPALVGHIVRFTGWLFADAQHKGNAENTNPGGKHNWRRTINELHPVTSIEIVE